MTRLLRFSVAGLGGFAVQIAMLAALTHLLGLHYLAATIIAVEAAILVNFAWHERWTWRRWCASRGAAACVGRLLRFNALTAVTSIAGSVVVTTFLVETASMVPIVANSISVIVLGAVNFVGSDRFVFRAAALAAGDCRRAERAGVRRSDAQGEDRDGLCEVCRGRRGTPRPRHHRQRTVPRHRAAAAGAARQDDRGVEARRGDRDARRGARASSNEYRFRGGLINHWRGTVFVPDVRLDAMLKVLQEPQTDKHKQEDVLSSRVVSRDGDTQKVFLRLRRTKFVTVVYDTEYDVEYRRLGADRALSNSISTKVVEIENAGTPRERALPEGNDSGHMWRLNSYWRYKQLDGGVLVEIESVTLSRSLPADRPADPSDRHEHRA